MDPTLLFRPRALIVEDEAIVAMEIQDQMEALGWEVCGIAATGPEAVRLAVAQAPDLVLMDITLRGDMTGVEAAERIREASRRPSLLFLTATVDERIAARIRKLDPEAAFLSKPFTEDELRREAERALGRRPG